LFVSRDDCAVFVNDDSLCAREALKDNAVGTLDGDDGNEGGGDGGKVCCVTVENGNDGGGGGSGGGGGGGIDGHDKDEQGSNVRCAIAGGLMGRGGGILDSFGRFGVPGIVTLLSV